MFTKNSLPLYYFGDNYVAQSDNVSGEENENSSANRVSEKQENTSADRQNLVLPTGAGSISLGSNYNAEELHLSEPNLSRIPSPASSVASTKKLEWDSGADIGYNIYDSFKNSIKSRSFPILNMDLSSISHINKPDDTKDVTKVTDNVAKENTSNKNCQSSSSQVNLKPTIETKRKSTFSHSTPYEQKIMSKTKSQLEKKNFKQSSCKTSSSKDECLQTTLIHICSKSVQTDNEYKPFVESELNKMHSNKSQQTDILDLPNLCSSESTSSKSGSFQYIPGSNFVSKSSSENNIANVEYHSDTPKSKDEQSDHHQTNRSTQYSSRSSKNSSKSLSSSHNCESTTDSSNSPLGKMISTQQSKHLIADIDKSLHILHKFIKSKHYNADTKKHYAKKIVSKIIQSNYAEDSSSTNKSDSTKSSLSDVQHKDKESISARTEKTNNTEFTDEINHKPDEHDCSKIKLDKQKPTGVDCGIQCDNDQNFINQSAKIIPLLVSPTESADKKSIKSSKEHSDKSNKSWKTDQTLSEKLFEARQKHSSISEPNTANSTLDKQNLKCENGTGDYLVQHSKKERKRQLSWINNEILYLRKLKDMLQQNDVTSDVSNETQNSQKCEKKSDKELIDNTNRQERHSSVASIYSQQLSSRSSPLSLPENRSNASNSDHVKKLSKYLTNEQIKYLIKNDAKKMHCQTCGYCNENVHSKKFSSFPNSCNHDHANTNKENSPQDTIISNLNAYSYNSHNYTYDNKLVKACQTSKINTPVESVMNVGSESENNVKVDASIQCTLKKKRPIIQKSPKSDSTDTTQENSNRDQQMHLLYENLKKFHQSNDTLSSKSSNQKQNGRSSKNNIENRPKNGFTNQHPIAYFLTFEEQTPDNMSIKEHNENKPLEKITVKIPKLPKKTVSKSNSNTTNLTLQEYLNKNRPDFVHAAEWRRQHLHEAVIEKPKYLFTCKELKEITEKQYKKLPEVLNKIKCEKVQNQRRHNRHMADLFSKKLQKYALQGHMSLSTCVSVITS